MQILSAIRELATFATNTNKPKGTNVGCRWLVEAQCADTQRAFAETGGAHISRSKDFPFNLLRDVVASFFRSKLCRDNTKLALHMVSNIQPMSDYDRIFLQALVRSLQPAPGVIDLTMTDMSAPTHTSPMSASSPPALVSLSPSTPPTELPPSAHVIRAPKRPSGNIATTWEESSGPSPTQAAARMSFLATSPSSQQRAFSAYDYAPYTLTPLPPTLQVNKAKRRRTLTTAATVPKPAPTPAIKANQSERHAVAFAHRHRRQ